LQLLHRANIDFSDRLLAKPKKKLMLSINMFGILAGIKVQSGRLNSFKLV
jgi:hypothetical protein